MFLKFIIYGCLLLLIILLQLPLIDLVFSLTLSLFVYVCLVLVWIFSCLSWDSSCILLLLLYWFLFNLWLGIYCDCWHWIIETATKMDVSIFFNMCDILFMWLAILINRGIIIRKEILNQYLHWWWSSSN